MPIPLGILAVAGAVAPVAAGDYELLVTSTLTSSAPTFTINVSSYSDYKHLQLRYTARSTRGGNEDGLLMYFNSDTAANYAEHSLSTFTTYSNPASGGSINKSNFYIGSVPAANRASTIWGSGVADILDAYSSSKNKTVRYFEGYHAGDFGELYVGSGLWRSTTALSSIIIDMNLADIASGSRFSLYGLKG